MPYNLWVATINIQTPETSAHQFCQANFFFLSKGEAETANRNQDTLLDCILFYVIVFIFIILPVIFVFLFFLFFVCLALDLRFKKHWSVFYFLNFSILPFFSVCLDSREKCNIFVSCMHNTNKRFIYFFFQFLRFLQFAAESFIFSCQSKFLQRFFLLLKSVPEVHL